MSQAVYANEERAVESEIVFIWTKGPRSEIRRESCAAVCDVRSREASNGREDRLVPSAD